MAVPISDIGYAKINLALHVRQRRAEGYHTLETLFAFAEDGDVLTAVPAEQFALQITGPFAEALSASDDNLVLRAARAFAEASGLSGGVLFTLDKRLPIASGIGGGSADAAAALRLMGRLWPHHTPKLSAMSIAGGLGADVPACLLSQTCLGTGVGDELHPMPDSNTAGLSILLVNPGLACPTGPVFQAWDGVDRGPLHPAQWRQARNDLEAPARHLLPAIGEVLSLLSAQDGVTLSRMSGSGATCFALFDTLDARDAAQDAVRAARPDWWALASRLR